MRLINRHPERSSRLLLVLLPYFLGLPGIALAALGGVIVTNLLLMQRQQLLGQLGWPLQWGLSAVLLGFAAVILHPLQNDGWQLGLSTVTAALVLGGLAGWFKPWKQ